MKLTKKAAALLLAASLAVSVCATPVFADDTGTTEPAKPSTTVSEKNTEKTANTDVTYKVDSKYTWSIPAKIDFGANAGTGQTLIVNADKGAEESNVLPSEKNKFKGSAPMVYVTENIIAPGDALKISIDTTKSSYIDTTKSSYQEGFFVGVHGSAAMELLYFKITKPAEGSGSEKELTAGDSEVLRVPSGTKTGKQVLVFTLKTTTDTAEKAGKYTGTIAFTSEVSSAAT